MSTRKRKPKQRDLRHGAPLWLDHRSRRRYPALRGTRDVDAVVVGGGITGVLTALGLARAGANVCLLESERVGAGSTAASSALLIHEPDRGFLELTERYGRRNAKRIWQLAKGAVSELVHTLKSLDIRCDLALRDSLYVAATEDDVDALRQEFKARKRAGFAMSWLEPRALLRRTGVPGAAGLLTRGNAQCDPYKACVGLAARAADEGAGIFERSRVTSIRQRDGRVRVRTRWGSVDADVVIVATGYATPAFRPLIGHFRMFDTYVIATPPLAPGVRKRVALSNNLVWDTERPYHYLRWTRDHRLLLGGGDRPIQASKRGTASAALDKAAADLMHEMRRLIPSLEGLEIDRAWHGLFALTPDTLPLIGRHKRYPHHLFALGYGGNGMTFGALAARMLVEQWKGVHSPDHDLFRVGRFR